MRIGPQHMSLHPAIAACRLAVRRDLGLLSDGQGGVWSPHVRKDDGSVLVACSGGADSLALLAATVFEARKAPFRVIGAVVDHGLQDGSADHTARVVQQMADLGVDETASIRVTVDPGPQGVEAGARQARYAALGRLAAHFGSSVVLLGHTLDDQAETVLLGLTHGAGPRSLQGMRRGFYLGDAHDSPHFTRPLLEVSRDQTEAACRADGIEWWTDPHNSDPRFVRARIRHTVLPVLERELGPGIAETLARTAGLLRDDVQALDEMAETQWRELDDGEGLATGRLETLPDAIRTRIIRLAALDAGALASDLTYEHISAVAGIVRGPRDDRQIQLPGHVTAYREGTSLRFRSTRVES
jgi:tRNA(Ile)-lysidine synthase